MYTSKQAFHFQWSVPLNHYTFTPRHLSMSVGCMHTQWDMGTRCWLGFNWNGKKAVLWWQSSPCSLLMASATQVVTSHLTYISFVWPLPFLHQQRVRITTRLSFQEFLKMERTWVEVKKNYCTPNKSPSSFCILSQSLHLRFAVT